MINPNSEFGYKLMKPFVLIKYKLKYKPEIHGVENIPNDIPFVAVANHLHKDDQYNIMMSTTRVIHYLAKEEYFEGGLTEFFYRFAGCIKVDRSIHDEEAKSEALHILSSKGCIGLFPEGTRNIFALREKEVERVHKLYYSEVSIEEFKSTLNEYIRTSQVHELENLLSNKKITMKEFKEYILNPEDYLKSQIGKLITENEYWDTKMLEFKYGAVSFAKKGNAPLLPFVTNGGYGKKLVVYIGKPIDINGMELPEANKLLREKMIELMQKAEK